MHYSPPPPSSITPVPAEFKRGDIVKIRWNGSYGVVLESQALSYPSDRDYLNDISHASTSIYLHDTESIETREETLTYLRVWTSKKTEWVPSLMLILISSLP